MKFMLFAATALAATTVSKRQVSVVEEAIATISSATSSLDAAINGFNGLSDAGALQSASDAVISAINDGNSKVSAIEPLGNEAAGLAGPIQDLASLVEQTVEDLKSKKQTLVDAGVGQIVYQSAIQQRDAAATFTSTVLSKVPETLRPLGQQISQPISDALNDAVSSFEDQANGGGNGGSSSTTTTTTTGGSEPTSTTTGGGAYPTGGESSTTAAPTTTSAPVASYTTTSASAPVATYTGAAIVNAANGYGAVAMAVLAGAAML